LRGKTAAVTAGTNTALLMNKMNNEGKLGMTIMQGKDHAESFLLVETGRASAWRRHPDRGLPGKCKKSWRLQATR
jgi:glutamate/aspartate transport system substrate-binding protein